jgi:ribosome biogenesis GTPase / thiamine phosphate phosphatase
MMSENRLPGRIVKAQSGFYHVETDTGEIIAKLRGRLIRGRRRVDAAAIGDRVWVQLGEDGSAVIDQVEPRASALSRRAPGGEWEQVIIANLDQAVFVFACADPDPNFRMLDRFLVIAESQNVAAVICANKIDLVDLGSARREFGEYDRLGYPVIYTSARSGKGLREFRRQLAGRISVLAGPSGVGKTSLLNAMQPGLGLRVEEISQATRRGKHTTVVPQLLSFGAGGYVADTPGLKALGLWDIEPEELDAYFPEMRQLVAGCEFSDCTHLHEPGCAVIEAVEGGSISPERYDSYQRMRQAPADLDSLE